MTELIAAQPQVPRAAARVSRASEAGVSPRGRRLPSLRVLITLIVVAPVAVVSLTIVVIASLTSRRIAVQLGAEITRASTTLVTADVSDYLDQAVRVSDLYVRRLRDGVLSPAPQDLPAGERTMFHDLAANPHVASICFSSPAGDCTWLLHAHGRLELGLVRGDAKDKAIEFPAEPEGHVDREHPIRVYHYDAPARPWFQTAVQSGAAVWTPIYFWFGEQGSASETGSGYTRAVRDAAGKLTGVVVIDVTLGALSEHLRQLPIATKGFVFIVDHEGRLVAASQGAVNSSTGSRLFMHESDSAAARAAAHLVAQRSRGAADADADAADAGAAVNNLDQTYDVYIDGQRARAQLADLRPYPGIRWQTVTVLPESAFLSNVFQMRDRAIMLALTAVAVGITVGLMMSRRLARPLLQLTDHVGRVAAGDFEARLQLRNAAELANLSQAVNDMAADLKHRMQLQSALAVATQVQQSLLPIDTPSIPGLDLASYCRYCDETGGDYFDFVPLPSSSLAHLSSSPRGSTDNMLIAVGDVTGHGIGAALLMATARGALRSVAPDAESLGQILTHVNHALASNPLNGMFMTMSLLVIDAAAGTARWASAGHDPAIVYNPATDEFSELPTSEFPLGIEPGVHYGESSRVCAPPGSVLVLGTDGIWEARNAAREMYGKPRLRDVIRLHAAGRARDIAGAIERSLESFTHNAPLIDDVTLVVVKVNAAVAG